MAVRAAKFFLSTAFASAELLWMVNDLVDLDGLCPETKASRIHYDKFANYFTDKTTHT